MVIVERIVDEIIKSENIIIFGHRDWDGDCLGSAFALKEALKIKGKEAKVMGKPKIPQSLRFLDKYSDLKIEEEPGDADLAIILDCSDLNHTSLPVVVNNWHKKDKRMILIDHHTEGNLIGKTDYAWVDRSSSSVSEMICKLITTGLNVKMSRSMATLLLTGIVTDTSSFQNHNTSDVSLSTASYLVSHGARMAEISKNSFASMSLPSLKVWGLVLERLSVNKKYRAAISYLTYDDIGRYAVDSNDIVGIANFLISVKHARMVVLISEEKPGVIKVSLRSRRDTIDVAKIAKVCGGGGHAKAAGFVIDGNIKAEGQSIKVI